MATKAATKAAPHDDADHDDSAGAGGDHGDPHGHGDAHAGAHHAPNRREYIIMFFVLAVLTALEVGLGIMLSKVPYGGPKLGLRIGLIGLALTKAGCVGMYFMHLKHETKVLRLTVMLPFLAPTLYAFVLISEAVWRMTRW
ncbi:MAG TPA: cytochrome C oxidase subunit IV family protein [Byssovorax sp.]|jgi:caa(3)-type oxidase subunit IV